MKKFALLFLFSVSAQLASATPTECYTRAVRAETYGGLGLLSSAAIELCKGSYGSSPTQCYTSAVRAETYGGLGLLSSAAIKLCTQPNEDTTDCYRRAVRSETYGGLGLLSSAAIELCANESN